MTVSATARDERAGREAAMTGPDSSRRILLAAGGTGGHIYPAVALAEALRQLDGTIEIQFVCGNRPSEWHLYRRLGIEPWVLPLGHGRPGMLARAALGGRLVSAVGRARRLLKARPVSVAVGFGSYISAAPLIAAWSRGARVILHEQNVVAGTANRALAPLAQVIATAQDETFGFMGTRKLRPVGNPLRPEILRPIDRAEARRYFRLGQEGNVCLCIGGSQGASGLNRLLLDVLHRMQDLQSPAASWQLLWSTGPQHFEAVTGELRMARYDLHEHSINPYIDEMARAYAAADLVIARAGAMTQAELTALGKPAIFVPLPHAGGHQRANAMRLVRAGAAAMVEQGEPDAIGRLETILGELAAAPDKLKAMGEAARGLGRPGAAEALARLVLECVPKKGPM